MSGNVWFHAFKRSGLLLRVPFAIEVSFLALLEGLFKVSLLSEILKRNPMCVGHTVDALVLLVE